MNLIWSGSTQRSPISKKAFVLWASDDFYHFTFVSNTTVSTCSVNGNMSTPTPFATR